MEPQIHRVIILRDYINSSDEVADALVNHIPQLIAKREWLRERNLQSALKIVRLASLQGWTIVYESSDWQEAHAVYEKLLYLGLRMLPFGEPLPPYDLDYSGPSVETTDDNRISSLSADALPSE
jgi:hypothetical protein